MNNDTKIIEIPALVSDLLIEAGTQTDNLISGLWKTLKLVLGSLNKFLF